MRMYCDIMIVLFMPGWYYRLIEVRLLVGWMDMKGRSMIRWDGGFGTFGRIWGLDLY